MHVEDFISLLNNLNNLDDEKEREFIIGRTLKSLAKKNKFPLTSNDGKVIFAWIDKNDEYRDKRIYIRHSENNWERDGYLGKYYNSSYRLAIRKYSNIEKNSYKFEIDDHWFTDPLNNNIEWDGLSEPKTLSNMNSILYFVSDPSWPDGRLEKITIEYEFEGINLKKDIIIGLPPDYDRTTKRYPSIYFTNGEHYSTYINAPDILKKQIENRNVVNPPILIMIPEFTYNFKNIHSKEYYLKDGVFFRYLENFIIKKLIIEIDSLYRTKRDPNYRAICGFGKGGSFSLQTGIKHSEVFKYVICQGIDSYPDGLLKKNYNKIFPSNSTVIYIDSGELGNYKISEEIIDTFKNIGFKKIEHVIFNAEDENPVNLCKRLAVVFKTIYGRFPLGIDNYEIESEFYNEDHLENISENGISDD